MRLTFKQRIFLYFFIVFALFTTGIILFEQKRKKNYKTEIIESDQIVYTEFIHNFINKNRINLDSIEQVRSELIPLLPGNLRVTILKDNGTVVFDNDIENITPVENHLDRPEIKKALLKGYGSNIRRSASLNREFMYYAKHYENYYIRVAFPYDVEIRNFLNRITCFFISFSFFSLLYSLHWY